MRVLLLISTIFFSYSCNKCETCDLVLYSNQREAELKELGLANNYPAESEVSRESVGELCGGDISDARANVVADINGTVGTTSYTIRQVLECE